MLNDTITNNIFLSYLAYDNWTNDIMSLISQTLEIYDKQYYSEEELCNGFREKDEIIYPNIRYNKNDNSNTYNNNTTYNSNYY